MSYNNLLLSSNSDSDDSSETQRKREKNTETFENIDGLAKKSEGLLGSLLESGTDEEEGDEEIFEDVPNTASWTKNFEGPQPSYCGLDEPVDSFSDLSTKSEDEVSIENHVSSVKSDDENENEVLQQNESETGDLAENLTRVEISIENGSRVGIDGQSEDFSGGISVKTRGPLAGKIADNGISAGAAFELQSNASETGISVQTDISIATRSEANLSVDTEQSVGVELQSNESRTGVSINNLWAPKSEENTSVNSEPEIGPSLKPGNSTSSLAVNIQSDDSLDGKYSQDHGVDLLLQECRASNDGRLEDKWQEQDLVEEESEFRLEDCKGSISLVIKATEEIGEKICDNQESDVALFRRLSCSDQVVATENVGTNLDSGSGNVNDLKDEVLEDEKVEGKVGESIESDSQAGVRLRTEEFKMHEAINHPFMEDAEKTDVCVVENVQFTWDFNTSAAINDFPVEKIVENADGKAGLGMKSLSKLFDRDDESSSEAENVADSQQITDGALDLQTILKIVDSPTQLSTKSLEVLSSNLENQEVPEELHNSKSFGIPNKKSSKNRSACSLVKHNNSVEIIRAKNDDDETETDDEDFGLGYGFAHKSSSSLGKHRDSVELLCGKRFDSGSSMMVQKMSFLNNEEEVEDNAAYQSRSGLLKIKDSVEIIGVADEDLDIGDVCFESSSYHSPRSILKINRPRSKEDESSTTRLVSWKDTTVETEVQNDFPDDVKPTHLEFSGENKQMEIQAVEVIPEKSEEINSNVLPVETKKKSTKKPPLPKVGNLIKLFSSSEKKAVSSVSDSDDVTTSLNERQGGENNEAFNEGDAEEIKKTFTFWKRVCEEDSAEEINEDKSSATGNENKTNAERDAFDVEIIAKADVASNDSNSFENESSNLRKKAHKFVDKFEGTSSVPNPMFKKFPLPVENVFVKDRVSVLERSNNEDQNSADNNQ